MKSLIPLSLNFVLPLLAACIGGICVLVGLALEKLYEKYDKRERWDSKSESLVKWKHWKAVAGWWVLMLGISIEVVDAGWTAYEIHEAINNDPKNLNVTEVTGDLLFLVKPFNPNDVKSPPWKNPLVKGYPSKCGSSVQFIRFKRFSEKINPFLLMQNWHFVI